MEILSAIGLIITVAVIASIIISIVVTIKIKGFIDERNGRDKQDADRGDSVN